MTMAYGWLGALVRRIARILLALHALCITAVMAPVAGMGLILGILGLVNLAPIGLLLTLWGGAGVMGCAGLLCFAFAPRKTLSSRSGLKTTTMVCLLFGQPAALAMMFIYLFTGSLRSNAEIKISLLLASSMAVGLYAIFALRSRPAPV